MARIPINKLGSVGLVADIFNLDTPPEAWTAVRNCRMGPYGAEKFLGHQATLGGASWAVAPYWLFHAPVPGSVGYWIACGSAKIYARTAQDPYTETNITRQTAAVDVDYSATETQKWNGGIFGGLLVMNNGVDEPQVWDPLVGTGTKVQGFAAYGSPWPNNYTAAVVRPFGRYLVAIDVTKDTAIRYPQLVFWSHVADPGAMPSSWNIADPEVEAGEYPLQDAVGALVDMRILRGTNMLYTTDQVWQMKHVGGGLVFGFDPVFHEQGALATNCIARFKHKTESHLVLGGDDLFIHNGQSAQSVITPAMRRWFFQQIDPTFYERSFLVANPRFSEVWVCIPETGATQPTLALVWNWETGAVGFRDLLKETSGSETRSSASTQGTPCIAIGSLDDVSDETWASDSDSWDSDSTLWDERTSSPAIPRLLMVDRSASNLTYMLDSSTQFDGTNFTWSVERTGLALAGLDRQGSPMSDTETVKLLTEIWPRFSCTGPATITVQVGTQEIPDEAVTWSAAYTYDTDADHFLSVYHSARFFSVRFELSSQNVGLKFPGYALELTPVAKYN